MSGFNHFGSKGFLARLERQFNLTIRPSTMTKLSLMTLAKGAKQLVVQEALLTTLRELSYFSWLTPMTNMGASALGAEMMTLLAPPLR
uniref:Uncharacterized protein n=1 Tax=Cyprinus carpio TaxID=7962 RepID=A0A8C2Q001_CYPCA